MEADLEHSRNKNEIAKENVARVFNAFRIGEEYDVPAHITPALTTYTPGIFLGFKIKEGAKNPYAPSNVKMRFATLDGRRKVEPPLSQSDVVNAAIAGKSNRRGGYFGSSNTLRDQWGEKASTATREKRYIITGNILQAYDGKGQLVAYTTKDGKLKKGILMPTNFRPEGNSIEVPVLKAKDQFEKLSKGQELILSGADVTIRKDYDGNYTIWVPMSTKQGGKYFKDNDLLELMNGRDGFTSRGGSMQATFFPENLERVLKILQDKHGKSVNVSNYKGEAEQAESESQGKHDNIQRIIDLAEKSKIKPGGQAFGLLVPIPPAVWNAAVDLFIAALKAGNTTQKAIAAGIQSMKDQKATKEQIREFERVMSVYSEGVVERGIDKQVESPVEEPVSSDPQEGPSGTQRVYTKNAETDARREELGMPEATPSPSISNPELLASAKQVIEDGYDVHGLMERVLVHNSPTSAEERAIVTHFVSVKEAELDALNSQFEKNASMDSKTFDELVTRRDNVLNDLQTAFDTTKRMGYQASRALNAAKMWLLKDMSLAGMMVRMRKANMGVPLSNEQLQEVTDRYNKLEALNKQIEARNEQLEEENAELRKQAEERLKVREAKRAARSASKEQLEEEANEIVDEWLKELRKSRKQTTAVLLPYAREIVVSVPFMAKYAKNLVKRGIVNIDEMVDLIHERFSQGIQGLTKRDVLDVLAGKYNEAPSTKDEVSKELAELRKQADLITKIEDAEARLGGKTVINRFGVGKLNPTQKVQWSAKLKHLRMTYDALIQGEKDLELNKARVKRRIADLQDKLSRGDFEKPAKKPAPFKDKELEDLLDQKLKLEFEYAKEVAKMELENRDPHKKFFHTTADILSSFRSLRSSWDMSAPFRQGAILFASHPIYGVKAFLKMFEFAKSQEKYDRWMRDLHRHPKFKLMQESGLFFADIHNAKVSAKEEDYSSNLADKVWGVKASGRAYSGFLNMIRADVFMQMSDVLESDGYTADTHPHVYEAAASFVNNASGRGGSSFTKVENAIRVLSPVLWSPRYLISRLNLFFNPLYYANLPAPVRKMALQDMGKFLALTGSVLFLMSLGGDDEDDFKVEWDPRSTDFLKIRYGTTRYDIMVGFSQVARFIAQFAFAERKNSDTGMISDIDVNEFPYYGRMGLAGRFLRSKLAPLPGVGWNIADKQDFVGNEYGWTDVPKDLLMPMFLADLLDHVSDKGAQAILTHAIPAYFGFGVQDYEKYSTKPKITERSN